jgi:hypothetical protein
MPADVLCQQFGGYIVGIADKRVFYLFRDEFGPARI